MLREHLRSEQEPRPKKVGLIFPGQGSQVEKMGLDLYQNSEAARAVFDHADSYLGYSISDICFNESEEFLRQTDPGQSALGTMCVAAYEAFHEQFPDIVPVVGGGISFGELPNLVAAGVIDLETFLDLTEKRSEIMEEEGKKVDGRMVSVYGLDRKTVKEVCHFYGAYPAIYYPGITIVSGLNKDLEQVIETFQIQKGKVRETKVHYPFHSPHMQKAEERVAKVLETIDFQDPLYPVVLNATATMTRSGKEIQQRLSEQLTRSVDLEQVVRAMQELGAGMLLEIGPKPYLSSLVGRVDETLKGMSIYDMKSIQNFQSFLKGA